MEKNTSMKCLTWLLLFTGVWTLQMKNYSSISPVDRIRHDLLDLDKTLRIDLSKPEWTIAEDHEPYLHVIKAYKRFGDIIETEFPNDQKQYLNSLRLLRIWSKTEFEVKGINSLYKIFRQMQREIVDEHKPLNIKELVDFARTILRDPASIPQTLDRIKEYIVRENLFIAAYKEAQNQMCDDHQSPHQLLSYLYSTIALTEIKGYSMIQVTSMLLGLYDKGTKISAEMHLLKQQHSLRTWEILRAMRTTMAYAPRDFFRCDPSAHQEDMTYTELKYLFQAYIVNEIDLNAKATCWENCGYYQYTKMHGCYQNLHCSKQRRCNGQVLKCEYVDADMQICPGERNSARRYSYIEYKNGQVFGDKHSCHSEMTRVDSWWRWLFWHCSYCYCYCDEQSAKSERYFSLRNVEADISENRVITGIKFEKKNQIIHIQIQEGELLPYGKVNVSTVRWKNSDNFTVLDSGVKNSIDYHTITWQKRALDLDDLVAPEDYLLTGIRFRMVGVHVNLEIRVTPYNYTSGKVIQLEKSYWHSNDNTQRSELSLSRPDIPIRGGSRNIPDSNSNQYLNFAPSDRYKDAGQSTIPFLDIQPVVLHPPVPISGAGIFHKGKSNSGGFVALKIITYDFSPLLQGDLQHSGPVITTNETSTT